MISKRILTVQDISCVGKCSMTVALPILAACGHDTSILPTSILSTHTGGFSSPEVFHFAEPMAEIWRHWRYEGILFDAIYTGYLGSSKAVQEVMAMVDGVLAPDGILIVDPAMADNGKLYSGIDQACVEQMRYLAYRAHVLIPNVTEASIITGIPYKDVYNMAYIDRLFERLLNKNIVITGVRDVDDKEKRIRVDISEDGYRSHYSHQKIPGHYYGTGDVFASCFTGAYMAGKSLSRSVQIASRFTMKSIEHTIKNTELGFGIRFEPEIPTLAVQIQGSSDS